MLEENWKYWSGRISGRARDVGISVRDALRNLMHEQEYQKINDVEAGSIP